MSDLISRQAVRLIESDPNAYPQEWNDDYEKGFTDALNKVLALPSAHTVDAVKHGEWLRYGEDGNPNSIDTCIWQCDKCLETYYGRTERIPNYCPNCGAKMDLEEKDE